MTKELTASVPSRMKIIVVPPPDGNIFTVGHCAEVLLQCKDTSTHPLHRETPRVGYGPSFNKAGRAMPILLPQRG